MSDEFKGFQGGLILHFDELDSTQEFILQNHESLQTNTCVWTSQQTEGRGRRGRSWVQTPQRDLAFSIIFNTPQEAPIKFINQWFAFALREAVESIFGFECDLKWPNDLKWKGQKLSGLLLNEISKTSEAEEKLGERTFSMGIGLNFLSFQEDRLGVDQNHISILEILNETHSNSSLIEDLKTMKSQEVLTKYLSKILTLMSGVIYQITKSPQAHFQHMVSQFKIEANRPVKYFLEGDDQERQAILIGIEESGALIVKNTGSDLLSILRNPWKIEY